MTAMEVVWWNTPTKEMSGIWEDVWVVARPDTSRRYATAEERGQ